MIALSQYPVNDVRSSEISIEESRHSLHKLPAFVGAFCEDFNTCVADPPTTKIQAASSSNPSFLSRTHYYSDSPPESLLLEHLICLAGALRAGGPRGDQPCRELSSTDLWVVPSFTPPSTRLTSLIRLYRCEKLREI